MSEGYATETALVREESNLYDRALDTALALCSIGFLLGMVTIIRAVPIGASGTPVTELFLGLLALAIGGVAVVGLFDYANVIAVTSQRVRGVALGSIVVLVGLTAIAGAGVTMGTILGVILLVEAVTVAVAGVVSRLEVVDTAPSSTAGVLAGLVLGTLGLVVGGVLGANLFGTGSPVWLGVAVLGGVALLLLSVLPREDVGSTLPTALVVGALGAVVVASIVDQGWVYDPENIDGAFTGGTMVPLFVMFGSLLSSWASAKSRAGFGATGRQYGAFYVINLNAFLMVAVMVSIVAFVAYKGTTYAFHGFTIGAPSAMVVLLPVLVLALQRAKTPAGTDEWATGARQFFRVLPLAAVGGLYGLFLFVLVRGEAFEYPFTYEVLHNSEIKTLDTAVSITPSLAIGNLLIVLSGGFLFVYFLRQYGSLRGVGQRFDRIETARRHVPTAILAIFVATLAFVFLGARPFGVPVGPTLGTAVVFAAALAGTALAVLPLAGLLRGEGTVQERAVEYGQYFPIGVFGGLGLFAAIMLFQPAAAAVPNAGPVDLAPVLAVLASAASLATAAVAARARRSPECDGRQDRILGEEVTLALTGATGFLTLFGLHVALTGADITLAGVTVGTLGSLSWPMTMVAYIPLVPNPGGIMPAVVGTIWLVVGASLFAVPLGVGAAIFLTEYAEQGRFTNVVEVATNALWSTPSIVFGLFGAAFLIPRLGGDTSLLSGQLVLGFMLLPLVVITSRESIKSVPDEYRDASAALGVNQWETIRSVVLPAAMPGVITGVILGVGRIAGETAPLILVLGSTLNSTASVDVLGGFRFLSEPPFIINDALGQSSSALPTQVWAVISAGVSGSESMGWGSAFVLLMVVLSFYTVGIVARTYFRRKLNYE